MILKVRTNPNKTLIVTTITTETKLPFKKTYTYDHGSELLITTTYTRSEYHTNIEYTA